jgi:GH15 family glucan-1,4-alpha-glucosidase
MKGKRIEDYALIGDTQTAALVARDGSIDWLCLPRFDSGACFSALLGDAQHGRWLLTPAGEVQSTERRYRPNTVILETQIGTNLGVVRLIDFMPPREATPHVIRIVEGVRGRVPMRMQLIIRWEYGSIVPWVTRLDGGLHAVAGPDALCLWDNVPMRGEGLTTVADFEVSEGQRIPFVLAWHPSHTSLPKGIDANAALERTEAWWQRWYARCTYRGEWGEAVARSLITLKALTYGPTGGIVAAPTTSLPEQIGGVRKWDYRYCWLRDATFTLYALMLAGYKEEAAAWRDWLLRAVAGDPSQLQIMYGPAGERRLPELELDWLPGYEGSRPVRIGNAAVKQRQLDVYGEVLDALHQARRSGIEPSEAAWALQKVMVSFLAQAWVRPDEGIWEVRGPPRHFTHSKVMAWVAFDRAIKAVERFGLPGPLDRWKQKRAEVHAEVCSRGYDPSRRAFTRYYGSQELDASLLMISLVGFLPPEDERVRGTVEAVERELLTDGLVRRFADSEHVDGLPSGEGAFLACTFVRSGSWTTSRSSGAGTKPVIFSSASSGFGTTWACSPRSMTSAPSASWELPAGILPCRPDQQRLQPLTRRRASSSPQSDLRRML